MERRNMLTRSPCVIFSVPFSAPLVVKLVKGGGRGGSGGGGFSFTPLWIELDVDQRDDDAHAAEGQQAEVEITPGEKTEEKKGIRYFTPIIRSTIA